MKTVIALLAVALVIVVGIGFFQEQQWQAAYDKQTTELDLTKQTLKARNLELEEAENYIQTLEDNAGPSEQEIFYQGAYGVCRLAGRNVEFCIKTTQQMVLTDLYGIAQVNLKKENWNWAIISGTY